MLAVGFLATGALLHGGSAVRGAALRSGRAGAAAMSVYDFSLRDLRTGEARELSEFQGKVSLMVNVASK